MSQAMPRSPAPSLPTVCTSCGGSGEYDGRIPDARVCRCLERMRFGFWDAVVVATFSIGAAGWVFAMVMAGGGQ